MESGTPIRTTEDLFVLRLHTNGTWEWIRKEDAANIVYIGTELPDALRRIETLVVRDNS
ncbi:MAG: hypothetical protein GTO63_30045 [Anaerolineae bacterium]|nr:hypothetical protein [Anaerolineae bacterium]NIN98948.1 hypothetical protein [Anaerolineae bacterium]